MAIETFNHMKKNGTHLLNEAKEKYSELSEMLQNMALQSKKAYSQFRRSTEEAIYEGSEKIKDAAVTVNRQVRKNPWAYIGGAALGALLVGIVIGKSQKKEPWER